MSPDPPYFLPSDLDTQRALPCSLDRARLSRYDTLQSSLRASAPIRHSADFSLLMHHSRYVE